MTTGIIMYSCAETVERIFHAERTLERVCDDHLTVLAASMNVIDSFKTDLRRLMGTRGPYKAYFTDIKNKCKEMCSTALRLKIEHMRRRATTTTTAAEERAESQTRGRRGDEVSKD